MIDKDISGVDLARRAQCTRQNVYQIIAGKYESPRVRKIIAKTLGAKVSDLWPATRPKKRAA